MEIYNSEDSTVNLSGYFLTDDFTEPQKWEIPINTRIDSGESILFWTDGKDVSFHTNFKLSQTDGEIGYVVMDVESDKINGLIEDLAQIPATIRTRILH